MNIKLNLLDNIRKGEFTKKDLQVVSYNIRYFCTNATNEKKNKIKILTKKKKKKRNNRLRYQKEMQKEIAYQKWNDERYWEHSDKEWASIIKETSEKYKADEWAKAYKKKEEEEKKKKVIMNFLLKIDMIYGFLVNIRKAKLGITRTLFLMIDFF